MKCSKEQIEKHIKTHSERAVEDNDAINTIRYFFKSDGKIITDFSSYDTWPNIDGSFELVPKPEYSRRPKQNFSVQIKGTNNYTENDGIIKYHLKSLAFPAFILCEVVSDPGLLIVVLKPSQRNNERIFWKYLSPNLLSNIDFNNDSTTINFSKDDEILNSDESINEFVKKLEIISEKHSFMRQLETREYSKNDVLKVVLAHSENICEAIKNGFILDETREKISRRIIIELGRLCEGVLILNGLRHNENMDLRTAWDIALLSIDTKFLATFLQGLKYIGLRIPEEGQNERLMLKYYDFLWKIRKFIYCHYNEKILNNLEQFPIEKNVEDEQYNFKVADAIETVTNEFNPWTPTRYYIQKKSAFYVGKKRYFELTLQLANKYATKFNRLTVYTKKDISTNYSIKIGFEEVDLKIWDHTSKIKVITNWKVSIAPASINKLSCILKKEIRIKSNYNEYDSLMEFLTRTGMNLLDLIDMNSDKFLNFLGEIYIDTNTKYFKDILIYLNDNFHSKSKIRGKNVVRYNLLHLKEDLLDSVASKINEKKFTSEVLNLSSSCIPFEINPILYNLPNHKNILYDVMRACGLQQLINGYPYIHIKKLIDLTGELYFEKNLIENNYNNIIKQYNSGLTKYDIQQGKMINEENKFVYIDSYVQNTVEILNTLLTYSMFGNEGQLQLNNKFLKEINIDNIDIVKTEALQNAFVKSKIIIIYGAAGTGKTTLMNYISKLMSGRTKLFLTKTHTALENLQRRIDTDKRLSYYETIDKVAYSKKFVKLNYDLIFVDECSTIDNRAMCELLKKIDCNSLIILAGDIYQIESIEFGNWFYYAKNILPEKSIVELTNTWRTQIQEIKGLWEEVRFKQPLITEKLAMDGPFSMDINQIKFENNDADEVVLCLNYDGKFGLNSINSYYQEANPVKESYSWHEWKYKVGDPIIFNESKRFPMLYNNLKGKIVAIEKEEDYIKFTIDVDTILTGLDIRFSDLELINTFESKTRISFKVKSNVGGSTDEEREKSKMQSIVPFQLAYAVSIHKAQGLEYDSIKVVIPNSNSEKITHGIFYTAITRAKQNLKIYWTAETMKKIISSFDSNDSKNVSLELIKNKLKMK